jgi:hypothetical protein
MTDPREARFRWRCSRCQRDNEEKVRHGWGQAHAICQCGRSVELVVRRDLDGRVLEVRLASPGGER